MSIVAKRGSKQAHWILLYKFLKRDMMVILTISTGVIFHLSIKNMVSDV
jgi:hypothetical protein